MDPDRWSRVDWIYHQAVSLGTADRRAFIDDACGGDQALADEVHSLLSEDVDGRFLEEPALAVASRLVAHEIPVLTGQMFGPYRLHAPLGSGAMGDVYRARDTILERDVAIKILPEAFSDDRERLDRFEKEAQFLASFSHPNIAAIYGVHVSDGIRGLVLELVDGETLAERIRRGPLPLHDAVRIARQIGEGLDTAHQRGIVHRDLKPSNIKIARDGTTKILDFGLAKSQDSAPDGLVLGTASYMSPEQARGDVVDKRTDIWAFGCVCFEMLTGQPAFTRSATDRTKAEPRWDLMPSGVSSGVVELLRRCLDEDPKRRRRDIGDALVDLDDALRERVLPVSPRSRWLLGAAAAIVIAVMVWAVLPRSSQRAAARSSADRARLSLLLPPGMDFPERDNQIAVSPDGTMIAYVAASVGQASRLVLKKLDAESEQVLGDAVDVRDPFFSPDGQWLGFIAGDTIRKMSIADGRSHVICHAPRAVSASWSHGAIFFGEGGDLATTGIRRVSEGSGPVEVVSTLRGDTGERNHLSPQMLPDGKSLIYTVRAIEPAGTTHRIVVQAPGTHRVLIDGARWAAYIGDSVLVYQRGRSLFATRIDLATLTITGPDVMLFNDVAPGRPVWAAGGNVLVYRPQHDNRRLVWVGRHGGELTVPGPPKLYGAPNLSPSGNRVALEIDDEGKFDIWTLDMTRQSLTRLTSNGSSRYPMWTPDGTQISLARRSDRSLFVQPIDGGAARELVRAQFDSWIGSWMPDGRSLVYMAEDPVTKTDLWTVGVNGRLPAQPLVRTQAREYGGRVSSDGRWLAYFSDERKANQFDLYVAGMSAKTPPHLVATAGAREAVWAKNGNELFYRRDRQMLSVQIPGDADFSNSLTTVLFEGDYYASGGPGIVNYDVSSDGQRFLMLKNAEAGRTPHLTVIAGLDGLIADRLPRPAP